MASVLLVDVSHLFWTHYHATEGQEVSEAYERTVSGFNKMRGSFDHVAAACDSPPYFRTGLLTTYKGNRPPKSPVALEQLARVKRRIAQDGFCVLEAKGFEADDILATAAKALTAQGHTVTLGTNDKDALQLVSDERGVSVLHPLHGATFREHQVIEKFGVHPAMMADLLALMGDASDNVPGIPGIGPKKAAKLLLEFGTLEGVLTHGDDMTEAMGAAVKDNANAARLARKVVELRTDVPIDVAEIFKERQPEKLPTRSYDVEENGEDEFGNPVAPAEPTEPPKVDALAKTPPAQTLATVPVSFDMALEPQSIAGAYKLAEGMFQSRLYGKFGNAEAIWAVIIRGREMGLGALTALDCFHVIEGKPALSAHLILARARQHPDCEYFQFVAGDDTAAEFVTKRKDNPEPTRLRYTIEQAKRAGLVRGGGNWEKRPDEMLRKTCAVQLARIEYPEAALGLYAISELNPEQED